MQIAEKIRNFMVVRDGWCFLLLLPSLLLDSLPIVNPVVSKHSVMRLGRRFNISRHFPILSHLPSMGKGKGETNHNIANYKYSGSSELKSYPNTFLKMFQYTAIALVCVVQVFPIKPTLYAIHHNFRLLWLPITVKLSRPTPQSLTTVRTHMVMTSRNTHQSTIRNTEMTISRAADMWETSTSTDNRPTVPIFSENHWTSFQSNLNLLASSKEKERTTWSLPARTTEMRTPSSPRSTDPTPSSTTSPSPTQFSSPLDSMLTLLLSAAEDGKWRSHHELKPHNHYFQCRWKWSQRKQTLNQKSHLCQALGTDWNHRSLICVLYLFLCSPVSEMNIYS